MDSFQSSVGQNLSSFPKRQKYIYQRKNKTICKIKKAASQTPSQINKYYYGTFDKTFKDRYNNNTATFRNKNKQKIRNSLSTSEN